MRAKFSGTCSDCGSRFSAGTEINFDRSAPKGKRTNHLDCESSQDADYETDCGRLVRVDGDNRLFARTRHGLRAGYENTGRRCEDAPCCGCCD